MNNQVAIPPSYFINSIKRQYSNPRQALFREFLQNSVDAGANEINFYLTDTTMSCYDNGCGMDKDKMVRALLTLSGSEKTEGATGGFGEAKNLLLFAHKNYKIRTKTNSVIGSSLSYKLDEFSNFVSGTEIDIEFEDVFGYDIDECMQIGIYFINQCRLPNIKVYINDELIKTDKSDIELSTSTNWCDIFTKKVDYPTNYVSVRKNGIQMFDVYISESSHQKYIIELTKNSVDCLSANRDSMTYVYQEKLQKIINDIQLNSAMFGSLYKKTIVYKGENEYDFNKKIKDLIENSKNFLQSDESWGVQHYIEDLIEQSEQAISVSLVANGIEATRYIENVIESITEITNRINEINSVFKEFVGDFTLKSDFIIDVYNKGMNKIPAKFEPATMQKRYETMALYWKACIIKINQSIGNDLKFKIGWVFSDETIAQYKNEDGIHIFQLNPEKMFDLDKKRMITNILVAACHEYTHMYTSYHSEVFAQKNYDIVSKVFTDLSSWREIVQLAETLEI